MKVSYRNIIWQFRRDMSRWSDLVNTINITLFSSCGEVVPLHTMKATRGSGGIT